METINAHIPVEFGDEEETVNQRFPSSVTRIRNNGTGGREVTIPAIFDGFPIGTPVMVVHCGGHIEIRPLTEG
jgi:hypothetical protein